MFLHFHFITSDKVHGNANHEECQTKVTIKSLFMVRFKKFKVLQKAWNVLDLTETDSILTPTSDAKSWYIDIAINDHSSNKSWFCLPHSCHNSHRGWCVYSRQPHPARSLSSQGPSEILPEVKSDLYCHLWTYSLWTGLRYQ